MSTEITWKKLPYKCIPNKYEVNHDNMTVQMDGEILFNLLKSRGVDIPSDVARWENFREKLREYKKVR